MVVLILSHLTYRPPNILAATTFLKTFLSLLSRSQPSMVPSSFPSTSDLPELYNTTSPTLNFLQLAVIAAQRAPGANTSAVQARGTDGGVPREWDSLCRRYVRSGLVSSPEVQEVSLTGMVDADRRCCR